MNENLNLVEILKDCPRGTKLYSPALGEVTFVVINNCSRTYPIIVKTEDGIFYFTKQGKFYDTTQGECFLFPSREQRDWSKFNPKKDWFVPPCEFKDGDILSYQCKGFNNRSIYIYRYHKRFNTSYYVALSDDDEFRIDNTGKWALNGYNDTVRFATEDEKKKLFKAIKDNDYEWNADTKTLNKLVKHKPKFKVGDKIVNRVNMYMGDLSHQDVISEITEDKYILKDGGYIRIKDQDIWELANDKKQRFDPKTLQPFDRVLVRLTRDCIWNATFFSHYDEEINWGCHPCVTTSCKSYDKCIPYNDETKHLLGTSDEAPEYYRYWEDW